VLGTGAIGAPVARRLRAAGRQVSAWDREPGKAAALAADGVVVAERAVDAVSGAEAVLLLVLDGQAVSQTLDEVLPELALGTLVIDMTTSSVAEKRGFAARVREAGGRPAEAPFFGTIPQAEAGALYAVVGCDEADFDDVRGVLASLCSGLFPHGGVGEASALKLAANVLVFPMVELIAEALALAEVQGVDPAAVLALLEAGTGVRSPIYLARGRLMVDGDFGARASVGLAAKDLELIHDAASAAGLQLPLLERTRSIFAAARAAGLEGEDMAAVYKLVEGRTA
jgi:3-hydroxyisobutyrate dehydrogenase-like beta-hydroxyacid dehydrogenase